MKDKIPKGRKPEIGTEMLSFKADPKQTSIRLDKFLLDRMEKISRSKIQQGIKEGRVTVNGKEVKSNYLIRPLDDIIVSVPRYHEDFRIIPEDIPIDIRYEDDDVLIVNKPAGMVVHPGVGNYSGTLVNALAHYFGNKELPIKEGNEKDRPGLVHRIDKDTTGLLLIAKNDVAMTLLSKQFFEHSIDRVYTALVWGEPEEPKGTFESHIGRHDTNAVKYQVYPEGDKGKWAVTHYETIDPLYYVSLVQCVLETGRTHQIRVHLSDAGHPLFNDTKYGGSAIVKGTVFSKYRSFVENAFKLCSRQALHAGQLGFIHPTTNKKMEFTCELPDDMAAVLEKWKKYVKSKL